ncbi:MAG: NAD-dependent epimerase/dehydratase family protein [Mycetocola sp.]
MTIAVTGSTGKLGAATVARLAAAGEDVVGFDRAPSSASPVPFTRVDLGDYGQTIDALMGVTARHEGVSSLVHLAAIPVNGLVPDAATFQNNMAVAFNVAHAAVRLGITRLVVASSITALGFPFDEAPEQLPLTEDCELRATNTYALVKVLEETMYHQLVRWNPELSVTALRFTNVVEAGEYEPFEQRGTDPQYRRDLLWSYVDARDGAQAVQRALAAGRPGFRAYNVAATDSGLSIPSRELAEGQFPGTPIDPALSGHSTLLSIDRARAELGYEPQHLWRDELRIQRGQ